MVIYRMRLSIAEQHCPKYKPNLLTNHVAGNSDLLPKQLTLEIDKCTLRRIVFQILHQDGQCGQVKHSFGKFLKHDSRKTWLLARCWHGVLTNSKCSMSMPTFSQKRACDLGTKLFKVQKNSDVTTSSFTTQVRKNNSFSERPLHSELLKLCTQPKKAVQDIPDFLVESKLGLVITGRMKLEDCNFSFSISFCCFCFFIAAGTAIFCRHQRSGLNQAGTQRISYCFGCQISC